MKSSQHRNHFFSRIAFTLAVSLYFLALCRSCDIARSNGNRLYGKNYTFKHLLFRHIIWLFKQWYVGPLVIDDVNVDHDGYEFVGGRLKQWKIAVVLLFVIYALHKMHWTDYEHDLCVCAVCVVCYFLRSHDGIRHIFLLYLCFFLQHLLSYCLPGSMESFCAMLFVCTHLIFTHLPYLGVRLN